MVMLPALRVHVVEQKVGITKKFLEGMIEFQRFWRGPIKVLMQTNTRPSDNLDDVFVSLRDLPFELVIIPPPDEIDLASLCEGASVVLASLDDHRQTGVSEVCRGANIPCVYITEYTFQTRVQSVAAYTPSRLRRWRSYFWLCGQERARRAALRLADAVQCNGTPTFDAYNGIAPNQLLYFDTRVRSSMIPTQEDLERRCVGLLAGEPLRLIFSGRLARVKGADHLIDVAAALREKGVPFRMSICGGGELEQSMRARVADLGLTQCVQLMGTLDFEKELIPFVKQNADLFICCHRQGDPSCTYLETMACGVPIVGYDNEAMAGLARERGLGWTTPMDRPVELAESIARLHRDREALRGMALKSLTFAQQHSVESTFRARTGQILQVARQNNLEKA
jgi:glycosyltransferase involved in cell wall biosynthesis